MKITLQVIQIILSGVLILLILIQPKGKGFGKSLGGSVSFTRRGLERVVFRLTFIISTLFIILSVLSLIF